MHCAHYAINIKDLNQFYPVPGEKKQVNRHSREPGTKKIDNMNNRKQMGDGEGK